MNKTEIKNQILDAMKFREATKVFDETKKISDEDFNFILEVGRLSPSSFGWEPWQFLVVQNEEVRAKLKEVSWGAQGSLPTASHFVIFLGRKPEHVVAGSEYLTYISREINKLPADVEEMKIGAFDMFQKSNFDLVGDRKIFDWVGKQCYLAFSNMMTAAAQIGIDSCPIEGIDPVAVTEILVEAGALDTSKYGVVAAAAFGYRKESLPYTKTRREMDEVVAWVK